MFMFYRSAKQQRCKKFQDLPNGEIVGLDLSFGKFQGCDFRGRQFRDTEMSWTNFSGADFRGCTFDHVVFDSVDARGAKFDGADLAGFNRIHFSNFEGASFVGAGLSSRLYCMNFRGANFEGAGFSWVGGCDFTGANLKGSHGPKVDLGLRWGFAGCDFRGATLEEVSFEDGVFESCNFEGVSFKGAKLEGVTFHECNLENVDLSAFPSVEIVRCHTEGATLPPNPHLLREGKLLVFKKVRDGVVLTLEIPADAKRVQPEGSRKCRANKAVVLAAHNMEGNKVERTEFRSKHDYDFVYNLGETVEISDFNEDPSTECGAGVHFFMLESEARKYS